MLDVLKEKIEKALSALAEESSLDIVEITLKKHRQDTMLDVICDKPEGGISVDECSAFNKKACELIDEERLLEDPYTVEVSSPGLDRPLKTEKDFRRNIGKEVEVYLSEKVNEKNFWTGAIKDVTASKVTIVAKEETEIPLDLINKALLVLPL